MAEVNSKGTRYRKKEAEQTVELLIEANNAIERMYRGNKEQTLELLIQCQESAILLAKMIESLEGEYEELIKSLEAYCENIYQMSAGISDENSIKKILKKIKKQLMWLYAHVKSELPENKKEIVFLPYKVSMWDSLESIWKAAKEDKDADVYVIPIPYFEKTPDGSPGKIYYEGEQYPEEVEITQYHNYNFEERKPDIIFIHNPYDDVNFVTSVFPFFFSEKLKEYTEKLVYIPYYVVPWSIGKHFVLVPGVMNADYVFVQSELIRKQYIRFLKEAMNVEEDEGIEEKIIALGSPKTDKILMENENRAKMPEEWNQKIGRRKVVFFNTNVSLLLNNGEYFIQNLRRIFHIFKMFQAEFVLLWREHPLTIETLHSMRPQLLEDYLKLRQEFKEQDYGILDESANPHTAMAVSDCYFGAGGSLVTLYSVTGKPMMLTAYHYPEEISEKEITKEELYTSLGNRTYYKEQNINALKLFLENYEEIAEWKKHRIEIISKKLANLDGTVGSKIYQYVTDEDKI